MVGSTHGERAHDTLPPVRITVVESLACHFCLEAHRVLDDLTVDFPLIVENLNIREEAGRLLMAKHRAAMSPLVLVDGVFFSNGRLPRRKLTKLLNQRFGTSAAAGARRGGVVHG